MIYLFKVMPSCWLMYFKNFRSFQKLDPVHFLSALKLVWKAALKKTKVKLDLLIGTDVLLLVEKGITGEICHAIYRYVKASNKYMKNYDKNKKL